MCLQLHTSIHCYLPASRDLPTTNLAIIGVLWCQLQQLQLQPNVKWQVL